jgi:hypothetical protein
LPNSHTPQSGQTHRDFTRPLSAVPPKTDLGAFPVARKPGSDTTTPIENPLPVIRWQSVQWQA